MAPVSKGLGPLARLPEYVERRRTNEEHLARMRAVRVARGAPFWDASAERYDRAVPEAVAMSRRIEGEAVAAAELELEQLRAGYRRCCELAACSRLRGMPAVALEHSVRSQNLLEQICAAEARRADAVAAARVCVERAEADAAQRIGLRKLGEWADLARDRARARLQAERRAEWELAQLEREMSRPGAFSRMVRRQVERRSRIL